MEIPKELKQLVMKRAAHFPVEGFVTGKGPKNPRLMLIGEAPGETEIGNQIPFSGRAGKELMTQLENIGLSREQVYITSAVRSRPYRYGIKTDRKTGTQVKRKYNRPPTQSEILAHAPVLDYEIEKVKPSLIVTLGNVGLKRILGSSYQVSAVHGEILQQPVKRLPNLSAQTYIDSEKTYTIIPTFHPASIFYNRNLLPLIIADWQQIAFWLKENEK